MTKGLLVLDAAIAVACVACFNPGVTGYSLHEWIGLVACVVVAAHAGLRSPALARRARCSVGFAVFGEALVSVALFVMLGVCLVSGLMVSGSVLQVFGLYAPGYLFWNPLHSFSAKAILALAIVHVVLCSPRFAALVRQVRGGEAMGRKESIGE